MSRGEVAGTDNLYYVNQGGNMIINGIIERECCDDLRNLESIKGTRWWDRLFKCKNCGQQWKWEIHEDGQGGKNKRLVKIRG